MEAKGIKEHHFKNYIKRLCTEKRILKGTQAGDNFVGVLDINYFNDNWYVRWHVFIHHVCWYVF